MPGPGPGPGTTAPPALTVPVPVYRVGRMPTTCVLQQDDDDELVSRVWDDLVRAGIENAII